MSDVEQPLVYTQNFSFSWGGHPARAIAQGDGVTIEYDNDEILTYNGVRGESAYIVNIDRRAKITVRLQSISPTIPAWWKLHEAIRLAQSKLSQPFLYKIRSAERVHICAGSAVLTKFPHPTAKIEMPEVEFVFVSTDAVTSNV